MKKLKICFIGKYPPAKGGTASTNYWLVRTLADAGHDVYVVTDSYKKGSYMDSLPIEKMKEYEPEGVKVFCPDPSHKYKILKYKPYNAILTATAIEVIKKYKIDIIDSKYLFPYGWVAFIAKTITNRPLLVRHAGSDITRLMKDKYIGILLREILKNADKIAVNDKKRKELLDFGIPEDKFISRSGFGVNHKFFSNAKPFDLFSYTQKKIKDVPIITAVGKMHKYKGVIELIKAASHLKDLDFILLFLVESEKDKDYVKNYIKKYNLKDKTIFIDYQPPWVMPSIYKISTCVVCAEHNHPLSFHTPLVATEALHAGKCVIISEETFKKYPFFHYKDGKDIVVVDPLNIKKFSEKLRSLIEDQKKAKKIGREAAKLCSEEETKKLIKIYYKLTKHNVNLVNLPLTFKCNNNCISCILKDKKFNKTPDPKLKEIKDLVNSIDPEKDYIELSGGEPTLRKEFFEILSFIRKKHKSLHISILSNGRMFFYESFTKKLADLNLENYMVVVTLYGHRRDIHEKITRAKNSFNQTVQGIKNLLNFNIPVEIRIVINKINYKFLPDISEFILKNFKKTKRVVFVNMTYTGNAFLNKDKVFVKETDVVPYVEKAVKILKDNLEVVLCHFPLCIIKKKYWKFVKDRTKDKKESHFTSQCKNCKIKRDCPMILRTYLNIAGTDEFNPILND